MSANLLPVSKAKTAYGILSEVIKLVREEPRRMRMGVWGGHKGNAKYLSDERQPACGTVGCIGGWTEFLTGHKKPAQDVLGFDRYSDEIDGLFFGDPCNDDNQGSPKHARRVISLIRKFQRKHKTHLLAQRVRR